MKKKEQAQSVGIDVAKATIEVAVMSKTQETTVKSFSNETESSMKNLIRWLRENDVNKETPIVVESTGSYHWLSRLILIEE